MSLAVSVEIVFCMKEEKQNGINDTCCCRRWQRIYEIEKYPKTVDFFPLSNIMKMNRTQHALNDVDHVGSFILKRTLYGYCAVMICQSSHVNTREELSGWST